MTIYIQPFWQNISILQTDGETDRQKWYNNIALCKTTERLREGTEHLDIFLFFRPSLNGVLFPMFCLLVEGKCQISVF